MQAAATYPGMDERGNYNDKGDFHRPGESLDDLVPRMLAHLRHTFPEYEFSPERRMFAGGRSITMHVISGPEGLSDSEAGEAFTARVRAEMERFDHSHGNALNDYAKQSFFGFAKIDQRYHAQHAKIPEGTDVEPKMTLAAFKRTIKAGDTIVLESTNNPYSQKMIGIEREVVQVRSGDFITHGADGRKIYCDFPKAAAFACDGQRFRMTDASEHDPDGYRLYRWNRD